MKTRDLTMTGLMAALIFVCIYAVHIPTPLTGGYIHLGDCMIFLAVILLGRKKGSIAAGIGGAIADLIVGASIWIVPTLVIKFTMAFIMGTIIQKIPNQKYNLYLGALLGGVFQIIAYCLVGAQFYGIIPALTDVPGNIVQTTMGIILFAIIYKALNMSQAKLFQKQI